MLLNMYEAEDCNLYQSFQNLGEKKTEIASFNLRVNCQIVCCLQNRLAPANEKTRGLMVKNEKPNSWDESKQLHKSESRHALSKISANDSEVTQQKQSYMKIKQVCMDSMRTPFERLLRSATCIFLVKEYLKL